MICFSFFCFFESAICVQTRTHALDACQYMPTYYIDILYKYKIRNNETKWENKYIKTKIAQQKLWIAFQKWIYSARSPYFKVYPNKYCAVAQRARCQHPPVSCVWECLCSQCVSAIAVNWRPSLFCEMLKYVFVFFLMWCRKCET